MSLANKYRPQTFDQMIGQEHIIDILKAQMKARDTVHHNYLLFGPRGTGKTSSARLIAKGLNCLNLQDGNPCNQCANCKLINEGTSLDYVEIDAASHTGVDNIREEIIDKALYPPTALQKKIYVIDEVHMLSKGAFNALLKTIEEPKSNVCFIFATTEIHKVPDTIISRCQVFNYRKVPNAPMISHLEKICKAESLQYSPSALEIISNISEGCVRDAVKYVDQVSILGDLNEENVSRFLGVAGESTLKNLLAKIKEGNRDKIFADLDEISQHGIDLGQFAKQAIGYIDQHLLEDTDFFLACSEIFGTILSTLRWYPYPIIAYKIAINKYLTQSGAAPVVESKKNVSSVPASVPAKQENSSNSASSVSVPVPAKEKDEVNSGAIKEPAVIQKAVENKEESTVAAVPRSDTKPATASNLSPSQKPLTGERDFKEIWTRVVSQISKPTVQANLKDQAIIEKQEGNQIFIVVITPIAKMLLQNEENKKQIEQFLSNELGENVSIQFTFEKKEDYFARKMGL